VGATNADGQRRAAITTRLPSWLNIGDVLVHQAVSTFPVNVLEISAPGHSLVR
jgi:hypothetical protein